MTKTAASERNRRFLLAFLNHIAWSTQPVASRYLQVYSTPVAFDGQGVLCTVKFASAILIYSLSHCVCPDERQKKISARPEEGNSSTTNLNPRLPASPHTKLFFALIFGIVATCRAALNIASTKFTVSYYLTTINSLTPIVVSIGDALLLDADLPPALWPCVFATCLSGATIGLSHSSSFVSTTSSSSHEASYFTTSDWLGCLLQFASMCFSAAARLLMKRTENILTRDEAVQTNNACNTIFPLLYTLMTNPKGWNAFGRMSFSSFLAWSTLAVLVYTIGSSGQMSLVRSMGPALYSSLSAVRVLSSALLSSVFLHEPVRNWLEWFGLFIAMITVTAYTISSIDVNECYCGKKQEEADNDDDDETPSIPMAVLGKPKTEDLETAKLLPSIREQAR